MTSDCGVFVAPAPIGDDGAAGTKEAPYRTLAHAVAAAEQQGKGSVFACSGEYEGPVAVSGGVSIYAGLDCASGSWAAGGAKSALQGKAGEIPLRLKSGAPIVIENLDVSAASDATAGGSSIAVIVEPQAVVELRSMSITAGDGSAGTPGKDAPANAKVTPEVGVANKGAPACASMGTNNGGLPIENACPNGEKSIGGAGGHGYIAVAGNGQNGTPTTIDFGVGGMGGQECATGGLGTAGKPGEQGTDGDGASGLGALSTAKGWIGADGGAGGSGKVGQGGGGGAGQPGKAGCAGASGGSGGAGGCGGLGGTGGTPGGSSIAIVSIKAELRLTGVTLTTGKGGDGGRGGDAQAGGTGNPGAVGGGSGPDPALKGACTGGIGGDGGQGGQGGGGLGGHSIGIAFVGTGPAGMFEVKKGAAGHGGSGGASDVKKNHGVDGVSSQTHPFIDLDPA